MITDDEDDFLCSKSIGGSTGRDGVGSFLAVESCLIAENRSKDDDFAAVDGGATGTFGTPRNSFTPGDLSTEVKVEN